MGTKNNTQTVVSDNGVNNKLNIEVMNVEKEQVATLNANINATEVASVEQSNTNSMKEQAIVATPDEVEDCGCSEDGAPATWQANINGKQQEIIIGFTDCNIPVSKKKEELLKLADKKDCLPVKYNVVRPEIFWNENYPIVDRNGNEIQKGTPDVYVLCPEPGTNCRIFFDEVLTDVEIIECESVQDWAKKVGTTNQLCQSFDKVKEVAVAALATGVEAAKQVTRFAMENNVPESVSECYLLTRLTPKNISLMMMGHKPKVEIALGRTWEDAQRLLSGIGKTFGEAERAKRYVIRAINSLLDDEDYDLDTVLEALKTIPAEKVTYAKLKKCGDKETCIVKVLTSWIIKMQRDTLKTAA
ncbi:hypothetical protein [Bacteroides intestinalis]|uniref:hypothetical protein n=1 Tax=Bacteroides intestinalis TaxID=329854 RepID=UPI00189D4C57|nr:hypothetical protein [Bacteroides intestinalis]